MRIPRFFIDALLSPDSIVELPNETAHYVANVLRLHSGAAVVAFNGDGNEYSATIETISKRKATLAIDAKLSVDVQSPLNIHLGQGVSKGDRMDFVLQKATELGVTEITPIITERCTVKLAPERWQKKIGQWQKIIQSACEQSGRNTLPTLNAPVDLPAWLSQTTSQARLVLDPREQQKLRDLPPSQTGFRLLIGPEGGLTDQETYTAKQAGYTGISLGPRILRTETAALTTISVLQGCFGDL